MAFDMSILDTLSIDELKAIKERTTELLKSKKEEVKVIEAEKKAEVKQTAEQMVKAAIAAKVLVEGKASITFTMNGKTWTKLAGKISDKTVAVDMGADVDTPRKVRYIHFDKITGLTPVGAGVEAIVEAPKANLIKKGATSEGKASNEGIAALEAVADLASAV